MWPAGTAAILAGSLWLLLVQLRPMRDDRLTMMAFALVWLRFALAALGPTALQTQIAGQSLMALGTLLAVGAVTLLAPLGLFRSERAAPIYAIALLGIAGSVLSGSAGALPSYVTLWALFAVLALLLERAYALHGPPAVLRGLLALFALPLAMQALSMVAGQPKIGPDGSYSYIGGYGHESVFAIVALGGLVVAALYPWPTRRHGWAAVALAIAALLFANYRTMLLAALPVVLAFAIFDGRAGHGRWLRRLLWVALLSVLVLPLVMPQTLVERFTEIGVLVRDLDRFLKPPETFTAADKDVLSARVYIWTSYAAAIGQADLPRLLLGHGPEALAPGMQVHPHNEYLRVTYQHGLLGAAALFGFLFALAIAAARAAHRRAGIVTSAGVAAVLVASTGTSLFDRPEGMIVLAILTATAWSVTAARRAPRPVLRPTA
ncbi:hypothetical protein OG2516_15010 [Oceanicola granulosus HTCC2516]|uniref:O-antigen ligase-related domain-containing protein n=1 Tax=Oceanicola granulosus (strain ATCC BAA-861 / DSM 15982 / KCTC 12143 / HTCC2516) TaxID=314256 RepID=Q2CER3_OCEGH|nr:O-antigen ligase family protein [Oceanicola granulosus]EAR51195.1 hypothetical protein OG2516_15010 [Oceanicola granulosus HTCC2516]